MSVQEALSLHDREKFKGDNKSISFLKKIRQSEPQVWIEAFSALQLIFLFFSQENELRKALIPFIGGSSTFILNSISFLY